MSVDLVKVTLDGRTVEVPRDATVLDAARLAGIRIPTLCHVEGLEPAASCFLCCVQIEGRRQLSPSCAMPVEEGMQVTTASEDVRASRRMALELLLSDHAGDCIAPCAARCPAGLDIPGFLYPLAAGDPGESIEVLWRRLPLAGSLGRVCPRLCEQHCRRMHHDDGLAIGKLHRWVADQEGGPEVSDRGSSLPASGRSVAIIGAGPAGLAAAYYLLREGHAVTLYDAHLRPGGMLRYGIPAYRLPKGPLDREIQVVEELGGVFRMAERWGKDFHLDELLDRHDAVFVAIGAQLSMKLRCAGDEHALDALELLAAVAKDEPPELGRRVLVVGGGNTAMDAARTARRLGADVRVVYRRTEREMPCLHEEVEGAREEGVEIDFLLAPVRVERSADGETVLVCQHMELGEPDESGRRRPEPIPDSETRYPCDSVIAAVGQSVATELAASEGLATTGWGIEANPRTLETSLPRVFAGGDAVLGADLAVRAIAAGRLAAASIGQLLDGKTVTGLREQINVVFEPIDDQELAEVFRDIERQPQIRTPELPPAERLDSFAEIDAGLSTETALEEARRCMSCGCTAAAGCSVRQYATEYEADPTRYLGVRRRLERDDSHPEVVYEPGKCILCDACVRIAEEAAEPLGVALIGRGFQVAMGVPFEQPLSDGLRKVAERCAEACPTGALTLRRMRSCDLGGCGGGGSGDRAGADRLVTIGK